MVLFSELPDKSDSDREGDWEPEQYLLRCCGGDRPRKKKKYLLLEASRNDGVLTIHDYLSVVHPRLMDLREDILQAAGDLLDYIPLPADTRLMVDCLTFCSLDV